MPIVADLNRSGSDRYGAGLQALNIAADRQQKQNERQAVLKNIIRESGLRADVDRFGGIVFKDKYNKKPMTTKEAMNIDNKLYKDTDLSAEHIHDVTSEYDTSITQDMLNQLQQAGQNNPVDPNTQATQEAIQNKIKDITERHGGTGTTSVLPTPDKTPTETEQQATTEQNQGLQNTSGRGKVRIGDKEYELADIDPGFAKIDIGPIKDPDDPSKIIYKDDPRHPAYGKNLKEGDYEFISPGQEGKTKEPTSPDNKEPEKPKPPAGGGKVTDTKKDNYSIEQKIDQSYKGSADPAVVTKGTIQQGMRDEVQDDYRNLQRKAAIFSALSGMDPNAHNPYSEMAKQRSQDLDFYNKNKVGVKQNVMNIEGGKVALEQKNMQDAKASEGKSASTSISTVMPRSPGPGPSKRFQNPSVRLPNGKSQAIDYDEGTDRVTFKTKTTLKTSEFLLRAKDGTVGQNFIDALIQSGVDGTTANNFVKDFNAGKYKNKTLTGDGEFKLVFNKDGNIDANASYLTGVFFNTAGNQIFEDSATQRAQ